MISLSEINLYPVKSLAGISLQQGQLDEFGLAGDRRWMAVKPNGHFITQRTRAQMALIQPSLNGNELRLHHPELGECSVPPATDDSKRIEVKVWDDLVEARHINSNVDKWLSRAVGEECHLVWFPSNSLRQCDLSYAQQGDRVGFADSFPLLLISVASLGDLNQRLADPVPMKRFRPNLVVSGCGAFAEDAWRKIRIGDSGFRVVKPCSRCVITTVDPETGKRAGAEPLATLSRFRKEGSKVLFGQNLIHDDRGLLTIGDTVEVVL
jgi:uncharacterized protein YcbX